MTYNPTLGRVMVDLHTRNHGQRSNGSNKRAWKLRHTHGQTVRCCQISYLPALTLTLKFNGQTTSLWGYNILNEIVHAMSANS